MDSDFNIVCPTVLFGEQLGQTVPGNNYYSYRLEQLVSLQAVKCSTGAASCRRPDVSTYMFGLVLTAPNASSSDAQLSRDIIRAWAQFAATGSPGQLGSAQWAPAFLSNSFETQFMALNASNYRMVTGGFYEPTCDTFWKPKLFSLYRYGSDD